MRLFLLMLSTFALTALAQDPGVQRELMQRQQQSDTFTLQLRQSQERLAVPPGDLRRQQQMNARQFSERQRLDNLSEQQLREIQPGLQPELRPYERQKADDARRPFTASIVEIPLEPTPPPPQPLQPSLKGDIEPIEAPR